MVLWMWYLLIVYKKGSDLEVDYPEVCGEFGDTGSN